MVPGSALGYHCSAVYIQQYRMKALLECSLKPILLRDQGILFARRCYMLGTCRGVERRDFLFFKADAEVILGRFAMMGIVGLFWIPFVNVSFSLC